jgi:DNA-binding NtrC family response regulator
MAAKGNILVVDNESDQLMMMKEILRRIGYRAKTAENPHDALKMIAEEAFSMVFIDLIMPDIDGTELCEQIKEMRPSVRVYAFSGHTHLYRPDQLERAGFDGSLNKPATIEEISAFLADAGKHKPKRKR